MTFLLWDKNLINQMPVNAKKLMLSVGGSDSGLWLYTHQTMPLTHQIFPHVTKSLFVIGHLLSGFWINLVLRARL
jgi:hypothetical protein